MYLFGIGSKVLDQAQGGGATEDISLLLLFLSVLGGYVLGIISGLLPGIHNNNFALALVAFAPFLAEKGLSPFYIAVIILSNALSQTFHDDLCYKVIL
ncbi:tripartite tricarboxylate transporter permease [Methanosarcina sp. MSH10X1]|uniref:tripartite tricarboxylate transporter permease n=1 Tax=Methanosarcina sp. MSH10X1 TaxID=2507075 RepID=UPI002695A6F8